MSEDGERSELEITDIRAAVKNENRVNVFVNRKYAFSLDVTQLVDFKLKKGMMISAEQLQEYKAASEFGKLYQRTLEWTLSRPRSEKEVRDYLRKKVYERKLDRKYIEQITERLKVRKYIDDEKFARYFVQNRLVKKGLSNKRLRLELLRRGVREELVDLVMSEGERSDEDEILKIIAKRRSKYDDDKLISYLCRQGFSFELARNLVRSYGKD